ncbi:uncharacterized protein A1O9_08690 [Exophiala aquamarina CBS 119918]|uniref:Uncharacterized protein n=1 Tax=Exophiala aquamarina CBS 119918 TaxID=1182545 RepID=A0A072P5N8_9EURO|nr:uncharacterized protein A1O9_08690 [Exophiala aquamarina CBS 119918]KEF55037.1 hypothetical protein A1O9_08690 [Exophiala aquamarina CBS 119918]
MGSGQRFHLPTALRRGKSTVRTQDWQLEGKDFKAQHILGITETALNTARNQSISSSTTARIPALTFSDTATELGSTATPIERHEDTPELNLKASSVLLHEEFKINGDTASSLRSRPLRLYGSNSTLNSYYDAQKTPLAISQQTSDSSRRDFALRKGSPVVVNVKPPTEKGSPLRFFRSSKSREGHEPRKLTKSSPPPSDQYLPLTPKSQRSCGSTRNRNAAIPDIPSHTSMPDASSKAVKGVHFYPLSSRQSVTAKEIQQLKPSPVKAEVPHIKVNIRRPRAGAKHWFDGLEGDSSEEGSVHEPEFHQSFVTGMEMAFEAGSIGMRSIHTDNGSRLVKEGAAENDRTQKPRSMSKPPLIPPRVSTLNAKSSRSTLSQPGTARSQSKTKAGSLASTDLQHTSILDLSSSDDEEPRSQSNPRENSLPRLRDSIAIDVLNESEIEVGTAKAIDTKQNCSMTATPSLRRVNGAHAHSKRKTRPSSKRHSIAPTYLSDQSSERLVGKNDLLTSFPATPTEPVASQRTSFQISDTASIESRRLMSVTRQEELLLAAMRSKRSALNQPSTRAAGHRVQAMKSEERPLRPAYQAYKSPVALEVCMSQQNKRFDPPRSNYPEKSFDQASCTTFQTGASVDPSVRLSIASYQTDASVETETEVMSQMSMLSPAYHNNGNRTSRSTFFSSSSGTNDSMDQAYSLKQNAYLTTLEKLRQVPSRDEVLSQDFIDWPYQGWEATSKLGTAH